MRLKVLSYNIHKGMNIFNTKFILTYIKQAIKMLDPDIVCLQEVQGQHDKWKHKIKDWPTETQFEFLADTLWPHFAYGKNAYYPHGHHGNAILSKFPIQEWHNLNLTLDKTEMRGMIHTQINIIENNKKIHLMNTHLNLFHHSRIKQLDLIKKYFSQHIKEDDALILLGDFNDWHKKLHPMIKRDLKLEESFYFLYGKFAATFPNFLPKLELDRAYFQNVTPTVAMVLSEGPWKELSDHLPIYIEYEV